MRPEPLQIQVTPGEVRVITLRGVVDELARFTDVAADAEGEAIAIQAAGITRFTSVGVVRWVTWMQQLEARENQIFVLGAPTPMVNQLYTVVRFLGERGQLVSFAIPYVCSACGREPVLDITAAQVAAAGAVPIPPCPGCQAPLAFDDDEASWVDVARTLAAQNVPEQIDRLRQSP